MFLEYIDPIFKLFKIVIKPITRMFRHACSKSFDCCDAGMSTNNFENSVGCLLKVIRAMGLVNPWHLHSPRQSWKLIFGTWWFKCTSEFWTGICLGFLAFQILVENGPTGPPPTPNLCFMYWYYRFIAWPLWTSCEDPWRLFKSTLTVQCRSDGSLGSPKLTRPTLFWVHCDPKKVVGCRVGIKMLRGIPLLVNKGLGIPLLENK